MRKSPLCIRNISRNGVLEQDPEKQLKYPDCIDIYAVLDDNERAEYQRDYPDEAKTMSRFAERFRAEGMQQGIQQGMRYAG